MQQFLFTFDVDYIDWSGDMRECQARGTYSMDFDGPVLGACQHTGEECDDYAVMAAVYNLIEGGLGAALH